MMMLPVPLLAYAVMGAQLSVLVPPPDPLTPNDVQLLKLNVDPLELFISHPMFPAALPPIPIVPATTVVVPDATCPVNWITTWNHADVEFGSVSTLPDNVIPRVNC